MNSVQHHSASTAHRKTPPAIVTKPFTDWRSELQIDVVSLIARRSGIAPASVRHQLSAFGVEVRG